MLDTGCWIPLPPCEGLLTAACSHPASSADGLNEKMKSRFQELVRRGTNDRELRRHHELQRRKVRLESAAVGGRELPAHDLGMSADEEVRERHDRDRCVALRRSPFPIPAVRPRACFARGRWHVEDLDAPASHSVRDARRVGVSDAELGQAHRVDGGAFTCDAARDRLASPTAERRVFVEGVDEDVGVEEYLDSRVSSSSSSQVIVGRRGAARMASRHSARLSRSPCSVFSSRTSTKRPSDSCWMSKTSPGRPFGSTMRFLESTFDVLMVGLSHRRTYPSRTPTSLISGEAVKFRATDAGFWIPRPAVAEYWSLDHLSVRRQATSGQRWRGWGGDRPLPASSLGLRRDGSRPGDGGMKLLHAPRPALLVLTPGRVVEPIAHSSQLIARVGDLASGIWHLTSEGG